MMKPVRSNLTRLLLLLSIFSFTCLEGADIPSHPLDRNQSYQTFKNISLPVDANLVNVIFQDAEGMIWLGTLHGLYNYNGYDLHEFPDKDYPNGNSVFSIVQTDDGLLCLGTDNGLRWFDPEDMTFVRPDSLTEIPQAIRSLALYGRSLWIGTRDNGLMRMFLDTGKTEAVGLEGRNETTIYSLEHADGKLFIASYEYLSFYDYAKGSRSVVDLGCPDRLMVNSLLWDRARNCVWVGTEGYLYRYDTVTKKACRTSLLSGNSFKALSLDADGNLLIGTDNGLFVYDLAEKTYTQVVHDSRNSRSLLNNIIWDIHCDRNRNIWLATDRGVSLAQTNVGQHYIHLSEIVQTGDGNLFTCMLQDSAGDYWLGGENGLIHIGGTQPYKVDWFRQDSETHILRHSRVRDIYEDSTNDIWIASDGGIARYDRRRNAFDFHTIQVEPSGKNANWAYSILEDRFGRMWIASYMGGLFVCEKRDLGILHHFDEGSGIGNNAYRIFDGGNDTIWASTSNGLVSIDINTMEITQHGMYVDNMLYFNGGIWYSSSGMLHRYDTATLTDTAVRLSETIRQIYSFIPENDRIWFTSSSGIFCIDPLAMDVADVSRTTYDYSCGLYDRSNGELLLGGEDCILRMDVDRKDRDEHTDPVFITSVVSNGRLMKPGEDYLVSGNRIELHEEADITVELSTFSYQSDESYRYRFGDEGMWQLLGKEQNHISLVNLSGGTYSLHLSSSDPGTDPDAPVTTYSIIIPRPWYLSWEAYVAYFILAVIFIVTGARVLHLRNKRKFELREKERVLELSNMKMDFFVNISHELKTPLSLILAPVSRMLSETTNANQKKTLTTIHDNAMRLNTLIHKVLDFKQLEAESDNILIRSHTEMGAMLKNCISTFSGIIGDKGISVNLHVPEDIIWANIDKMKIESAVINILSNAIKYVGEGTGVIDVGLKMENGDVCITVSDNGKGIDKEELSLVFIRYFQGKNGKRNEGSGIGLYVVKKYVELHGGHISIESERGTTVRMHLPLTGDNSCIVHDADDKGKGLSDGALPRILIIDDNKEIVAFLAETLSPHYECSKAYDGREGLSAAERNVPDLIIVDQMMPQMDGFSFTRAVRKNHRTATTPIIMLTAKEDMATELESIKAGVDIFMPKPFDIKKLQLRMAQLLRKRSSIEEAVRIEATSQPDFKECRDLRSPDEIFMEKVTRSIEENMGKEDFNVSALADIVSVDNKQLYRKLKQLTGSTPVNYIRKLRMRKASILLEEDKFTVSEVMFLVGYSNLSYFSKCFAEEFGMSPKDYRKRTDS